MEKLLVIEHNNQDARNDSMSGLGERPWQGGSKEQSHMRFLVVQGFLYYGRQRKSMDLICG